MKILVVTTVSITVEKFLISHIELLIKQGFEVDVACNFNDNTLLMNDLLIKGVKTYHIDFSRNMAKVKSHIEALQQLKGLFARKNYDILYTHTPIASFLSRYAGKDYNIKSIYFVHGFHFHRYSSKLSWLTLYPIEKLSQRWTDTFITINLEDYQVVKNLWKRNEVYLIDGVGVNDVSKYNDNSEKNKIKKSDLPVLKDFINDDDFVIVSVGELNKNKNHISILKAINYLVKSGHNDIKYIILGEGSFRVKLEKYIYTNQLYQNVKLLGYSNEVLKYLQIADLLVSMSYREGLPVSVIEAMMVGLPVVLSKTRGHTDLLENETFLIPINNNLVINLSSKILIIKNNKDIRILESNNNRTMSKKYMEHNVLLQLESIFKERY